MYTVCSMTLISHILYTSPAWWGLASAADKGRVYRFLCKPHRCGYSQEVNIENLTSLVEDKITEQSEKQ